MEHIASAIKQLFTKIGDFFDIFDLSFIVAGALCFGAVATTLHLIDRPTEAEKAALEAKKKELTAAEATFAKLVAEEAERRKELAEAAGGTPEAKQRAQAAVDAAVEKRKAAQAKIDGLKEETKSMASSALLTRFVNTDTLLLVICAIYVMGLVCFAAGRTLRGMLFMVFERNPRAEAFKKSFVAIIEDHGMEHHAIFKPYVERAKGSKTALRRLYGRLWVELRERPRSESYALIRRYWVLSATYDGVGFAMVVWMFLLLFWSQGWGLQAMDVPARGIGATAVVFVLALACFKEAEQYFYAQMEELVATEAHAHKPVSS